MANKALFTSSRGRLLPKTDTKNEAGGTAYEFDAEHGLAQLAATGCLSQTFYATADEQLDKVLILAKKCPDAFVARCAVYARKAGFMKDMPALLCAVLAGRKSPYLQMAFPLCIDNARMLRNFVQIIRSGVTGRKSLGSAPRRLVRQWLNSRSPERLFRDSVGQDPSISDVIKMVHPKPADHARAALYAYLIGKTDKVFEGGLDLLPELVLQYENYKSMASGGPVYEDIPVPDVPFQMLTALGLKKKEWTQIALNAHWQMTRMNLNTFTRHKVFEDPEMVRMVAKKLRDPEQVKRARVFPYQLLMAYMAADKAPHDVQEALQDAMEVALENVPKIEGQIYVFPDVSGSMGSAVTGHRKGATSKVRCNDISGLVAAALMKINPSTVVIPFDGRAYEVRLNPRDSVITNARVLAQFGGGSTNMSAPLNLLNVKGMKGDLVVYVSDNQSWIDSPQRYSYGASSPSATMQAWEHFKRNSPQARMVCIDVQPYANTQAKERDDIFNVGGFSDQVFRFLAAVAKGETGAGYWVDQIKLVGLNEPREEIEKD